MSLLPASRCSTDDLSYYRFSLPKSLIAVSPAEPRDASCLVYAHAGKTHYQRFRDIADLIPCGAVLVVNDSKVIPAELTAYTDHGGGVHINAHSPHDDGKSWYAFASPAKKCQVGAVLTIAEDVRITVTEKDGGNICLTPLSGGLSLPDIFRRHGKMPLPPYIRKRRDALNVEQYQAKDTDNYQTVYARDEGSAAAPTAGLHFTDRVFADLNAKGCEIARVTLHTGAGTFLPVKTDNVNDHPMHGEHYTVTADAAAVINKALNEGRPVIATGTTALRTLESAFDNTAKQIKEGAGFTRLFIRPGYRFQTASALITNFHLPESTLFMLVSAFSGCARIKALYDEAVRRECRFFSYGDACLLTRPDTTHMFPYVS